MEVLAITWWMWIVAGLGLMAMEAFLPAGFYLFFLGLAALGTGTVTWLGLTETLFKQGLATLIFMAGVVAIRKPVVNRFKLTPQTSVDSMVGETATATETIAARGTGRVELRGTTWTARNLGDAPIPSQAKCRVERLDGLTLEVRS
jgi:membrane protein implicated in regulation of membrane protease activity